MTLSRLRRPGVTLTEVMVAIFVMGIGMLALLTLFPLGAIQMAQALKDDRTGGEATHADPLLRDYWRNVVIPGGDASLRNAFADPQLGNPVFQAIYPASGTAGGFPIAPSTAFPPGSPSYPVFLDPLGVRARPIAINRGNRWIAGTPTPAVFLIPRRDTLALTTPASAIHACCLTDDLTFEKNGAATGPTVERQGRYNWAAVVQLPRFDVPSVATLQVLVFDGRPALLASSGDEVVVQPNLTIGERTVTLVVPNRDDGSAPLIRRGGWIMDSSLRQVPIRQTPIGLGEGVDFVTVRHANFYRISGLTDQGPVAGGNQFLLDLDTPIKPLWNGRSTYADAPTVSITYQASVTLFAGLSEVFERSHLRPDAPNN